METAKSLLDVKGLKTLDGLESGVYFLCNMGELVYIGKSQCVSHRISQHYKDGKIEFDKVFWVPYDVEFIGSMELAYITSLRPKLNKTNNKDPLPDPVPPPKKPLMTWIPNQIRWSKMFEGKRYTVSCKQLSKWCGYWVPPTKEESWPESDLWWKEKLLQIYPSQNDDYTISILRKDVA